MKSTAEFAMGNSETIAHSMQLNCLELKGVHYDFHSSDNNAIQMLSDKIDL